MAARFIRLGARLTARYTAREIPQSDGSAVDLSTFGSRSHLLAGHRLYANISEGLRPEGPLSGTKVGPSRSGDNITESGDLSAGIIKSRSTGKSGSMGATRGPFSDKESQTGEQGDTVTQGAESPKDLAGEIRKNDEAHTEATREDARNSPEEFKSPVA